MGYRTLFVCFNQPLASVVIRAGRARRRARGPATERDDLPPAVRDAGHGGRDARTQAAGADPAGLVGRGAAGALAAAIDALPDERFHAIVVDEGQDFALRWLESLQLLLFEPETGVFWVFHDPGQALFRTTSARAAAAPDRLELFEDYRCPAPGRRARGALLPRPDGARLDDRRRRRCAELSPPTPGRTPSRRPARAPPADRRRGRPRRGRSSCCRAGPRPRATSGSQRDLRQPACCGTARSTRTALAGARRPTRFRTSRPTARSSCSRPIRRFKGLEREVVDPVRAAGRRRPPGRAALHRPHPRDDAPRRDRAAGAEGAAGRHLVIDAQATMIAAQNGHVMIMVQFG